MERQVDQFHEGLWLRMRVAETGKKRAEFARQTRISAQNLKRWFGQKRLKLMDHHAATLAIALGIEGGAMGLYRELKIAREVSQNSGEWKAVEETKRRLGIKENFDNLGASSSLMPQIPFFELPLAAGELVVLAEEGTAGDAFQADAGIFRVRIVGDSMQPRWKNRDIVEFRVLRAGADAVEVGKDYCVHTSDGRGTFKRLSEADEDSFTFIAVNRNKYPRPIILPRQEVARMAMAVGIFTPR